jgi:hypothetical protein
MTLLLLAALLCFTSSPVRAQDAKPNFTGTWSLDAAKSDFGQMPAPESIVHVIEHTEPNVKITTTQRTKMGESNNVRTFTTDGKESTSKISMGGMEQEVKTTAKWDGQKLALVAAFDAQGTTVELNDTWTLSDENKILTIVRTAKTPQGDVTVKTVYTKQ